MTTEERSRFAPATLAQRHKEGGFGCHVRRNSNRMFTVTPAARCRYRLVVVNAAGDGFFKRVVGLNKRFGLIGAGRETLGKVPE